MASGPASQTIMGDQDAIFARLSSSPLGKKPIPQKKKKEDMIVEYWYCHCCSKKNEVGLTKCKVCGRNESYAMAGLPMPLHGKGGQLFRPSQVPNVLENLHEIDSEGWTPLHSACVSGNTDLAIDLLRYGSIVEAVTLKGYTALHLCVHSNCERIAEELVLNYESDINAKTKFEKITPLHMSCQLGRFNITKLLVENGADVSAKDVLEKTPLHYAAEMGRSDLGSILLRAGADPHALDAHGWTPRQIAELNGHRMFEELIVRATCVDKQVVFNKLPEAPWHNDVWFDVIKMQAIRQAEEDVETAKWKKCEEEVIIARAKERARQDKLKEERRLKELEERAKRKSEMGEKNTKTQNRYLDFFDVLGMIKPRPMTDDQIFQAEQEKKSRMIPAPTSILGLDPRNKQRIWDLEVQLRERTKVKASRNTAASAAYQCLILEKLTKEAPDVGSKADQTFLEFDSLVNEMAEAANKKAGVHALNAESLAVEHASEKEKRKKHEKHRRGSKASSVSSKSSHFSAAEGDEDGKFVDGSSETNLAGINEADVDKETKESNLPTVMHSGRSDNSNNGGNYNNNALKTQGLASVLPLTIQNVERIVSRPPSSQRGHIVNIANNISGNGCINQLTDALDNTLLSKRNSTRVLSGTSGVSDKARSLKAPIATATAAANSASNVDNKYEINSPTTPYNNYDVSETDNNIDVFIKNANASDYPIKDWETASIISALTDGDT